MKTAKPSAKGGLCRFSGPGGRHGEAPRSYHRKGFRLVQGKVTYWAKLVMEGNLYAHLLEVEDAIQELLDSMMPGIAKNAGVTYSNPPN